MDFTKATDDQLWMIISDDWDIPVQHIEGLVTEALNRNLFDGVIKHLIYKYFRRDSGERKYNYQDLFQIGYIGVINAMKKHTEGKGSFKTFAYTCIKSEFTHHLSHISRDKRKANDYTLPLDATRKNDSEESFIDSLVDQTQNPEIVTVNKVTWQEYFSKVSELEKEILILFSQTYTMKEIATAKGYTSATFISRLFHRAAGKINPHYVKESLADKGLVTYRIGA